MDRSPDIYMVIREKPISVNHMYGSRGNRRFLYAAGKKYKDKIREEASQHITGGPTPGRVTMEIVYYFGDNRRRDVTNYEKPLLDSLSGLVYVDDCQISDIVLRKRMDKDDPRTVIKLWRIQDEENRW